MNKGDFMWGDKRYHTLNYELRKIFGKKVMKLSLDGGFTCPNRDGTIGDKGCIFCGEEGSGEFAGFRWLSIQKQIEEQKKLLSKKWNTDKYIAYFQNFTNTYSSYEDLKEKYYAAISEEGVIGLAIATRPDCLSEDVLELLTEINDKVFLWIELGLQTIHKDSAKFIRRGYSLEVYDKAIEKLRKRNIKVVTHLIFGLPSESKEDILASVKYVADTDTWGVKFHLLYIQKGTDLYEYYLKNPFPIFRREEYISLVVDGLELLPKDMVVHRLTGDGKKSLLYQPIWSLDKLRVLSGIDRELKVRNSYQGMKYKPIC
jgi:radical SAM protein (TIGR01212 family)